MNIYYVFWRYWRWWWCNNDKRDWTWVMFQVIFSLVLVLADCFLSPNCLDLKEAWWWDSISRAGWLMFILCPLSESASGGNCFGLWQDWQERCHRQGVRGLQQHRGGAATLVGHAGQPPAPHRPVAHPASGGGGWCHAGSQEVREKKPFCVCPHSAL